MAKHVGDWACLLYDSPKPLTVEQKYAIIHSIIAFGMREAARVADPGPKGSYAPDLYNRGWVESAEYIKANILEQADIEEEKGGSA